jgi:hypothetical protein
MEAPYLYATWNETTLQYYAEIVVDTKVVDHKYLTAEEGDELDSWLQFLHGGVKDSITVPISEIIEHIEDGMVYLDDESYLLDMLWKAHNGNY